MFALLLLLAGVGIAMFHPPAGRDARRAAGGSATAMSYFAAGGSVGARGRTGPPRCPQG
ncbi:hypothetical protein ACF09J_24865 [Streptomyces sp. NPDC014889]|uniref:hypothetical protein n=1 Tax=Streptomyces sp. NPDC014889 TaxID=3364928 RepID=UPI0036FF3DDE